MRLYASAILAVALAAGWVGMAAAQQGGFTEIPSHPLNQSQGGGGVLEMPRVPGPQTGSVATLPQRNVPPPAPQTGELTIPPRELRRALPELPDLASKLSGIVEARHGR